LAKLAGSHEEPGGSTEVRIETENIEKWELILSKLHGAS